MDLVFPDVKNNAKSKSAPRNPSPLVISFNSNNGRPCIGMRNNAECSVHKALHYHNICRFHRSCGNQRQFPTHKKKNIAFNNVIHTMLPESLPRFECPHSPHVIHQNYAHQNYPPMKILSKNDMFTNADYRHNKLTPSNLRKNLEGCNKLIDERFQTYISQEQTLNDLAQCMRSLDAQAKELLNKVKNTNIITEASSKVEKGKEDKQRNGKVIEEIQKKTQLKKTEVKYNSAGEVNLVDDDGKLTKLLIKFSDSESAGCSSTSVENRSGKKSKVTKTSSSNLLLKSSSEVDIHCIDAEGKTVSRKVKSQSEIGKTEESIRTIVNNMEREELVSILLNKQSKINSLEKKLESVANKEEHFQKEKNEIEAEKNQLRLSLDEQIFNEKDLRRQHKESLEQLEEELKQTKQNLSNNKELQKKIDDLLKEKQRHREQNAHLAHLLSQVERWLKISLKTARIIQRTLLNSHNENSSESEDKEDACNYDFTTSEYSDEYISTNQTSHSAHNLETNNFKFNSDSQQIKSATTYNKKDRKSRKAKDNVVKVHSIREETIENEFSDYSEDEVNKISDNSGNEKQVKRNMKNTTSKETLKTAKSSKYIKKETKNENFENDIGRIHNLIEKLAKSTSEIEVVINVHTNTKK